MKVFNKRPAYLLCQAAVISAAITALPVTSFAAPGTISNVPLFLDSATLPNIFFMIDDSGSMDSDLTTTEGALTGVGGSEGLMPVDAGGNAYYGYMYATDSGNAYTHGGTWGGVVPAQEAVDTVGETDAWASLTGVWRARNKDYNKTYYDPSVTYEPWSGVNSSNVAYADATYTSVLDDPYLGTGSLNLTSSQSVTTRVPDVAGDTQRDLTFSYVPMRYYEWTDTNGNGDVDATDAKVLIKIYDPALATQKSKCVTGTPGSNGGTCLVRDFADEAQNFANWWQYHRRREYAMKASVGKVVANTNSVRMGISAINARSSEEREIVEMNNDATSGNKELLLDTVYTIQSSSGTPLLTGLVNAGDYYACTGSPTDPFGFTTDCPVEYTAVSPATEAAGACQQNFTILFTDGYYTDSTSSYGNADGDGTSWSDGGVTYKFDEGSYGDTPSDTLADVAMHYYESDLFNATDGPANLANQVPTSCGVDENPGQHMVTYTVGFGVEGTLSDSDIPDHPKYAYDSSDSTCTAAAIPVSDYPAWPGAIGTNASKIDDLRHAAYNGRGEFFAASNSTTLADALSSAIDNVLSRTGSASAVAFNSTTLGTDTHAYLALFDSSRWSGNLISYELDSTTGAIAATADWEAATALDSQSPSSRVILTSSSSDGIGFNWSTISALAASDVIRTDLEYNSGDGEKRLNYIRGDRSNEASGENYRERTNRLGDIVHSTPVFVGVPDLNWPDSSPFPDTYPNRYSDFVTSQKTTPRTEVVYVGANDGMLHGFNATTGAEEVAYIPRELYSSSASEGLHYLTDPAYGHRYYVDMTPAVSDAYIKTTASGAVAWHTVLVGSLGAGGRGLFALDITDPNSFSEATSPSDYPADVVMWEFTDSDDNDLGYTFSEPVIALTNTAVSGVNRWAAIFGNGYNSTNGLAKLFVVFLDAGVDGTWSTGDYIEISTGVGTSGDKNGLSSPAVIDTDGDGTADRVYAGDLKGNMWVFDISSSSTGSWGAAYTSGGSTPEPLFTGNSDQPITTAPQVITHPDESVSGNSNNPNLMVYFGTGQYLTDADISTTTMQSFYGIWDHGDDNLSRSDLIEQDLESGITGNGGSFRILTDNSVAYSASGGSQKHGWMIDFDPTSGVLGDSGERVVVSSIIRGDHLFFNTIVPSPNPCTAGGWGWLMVVKAENGGRPDSAVFDFNNNGTVDSGDIESTSGHAYSGAKHSQGMPSESSFLGNKQYTTDTTTESGADVDQRAIEELGGTATGRLSWEQLLQF